MEAAKDLEKRVKQAEKKFNSYMDYAEKFAGELGERIYYSQGSSNTHTKYELKNLNGFSIFSDTGQTMFGGEDVTIRYKGEIVLDLRRQSEIEIKSYESGKWEKTFEKMIKNYRKIISDKQKQRKQRKEELKRYLETKDEKARALEKERIVLEKARRMRLI